MSMSIALSIHLLTLQFVGYDLAAYILAARRLLAGEPLYPMSLAALGPFGQFLYPPPVALLAVPLAVIPFDVARGFGLVALLLLAAWLTWSLVRDLRPMVRYWAVAGVVLFFPLIWEVRLENLTLVTLALCVFAWRRRRSSLAAGAVFASALGLKLLPIALIPFYLCAGRLRTVAWAAAVLGAITLLTFPFLAPQWGEYIRVLGTIASVPPGTGSNIAPFIFSLGAFRFVLPAAGIALALVCGLASRIRATEDHAFRVTLAGVPLLASTLWYPYLVFAIPLLVAPAPSIGPLVPRFALWSARPIAWYLMQRELISDPGREFILPMFGLLFLIGVGLVELLILASRASGREHLRSLPAA